MDIDGDILAPEYIDKHLIEDVDPHATLASLNSVLADDIWHNNKLD